MGVGGRRVEIELLAGLAGVSFGVSRIPKRLPDRTSNMVWETPNSRIGDYPAEYNQKVHGPYDPARYYGPRKCQEERPL